MLQREDGFLGEGGFGRQRESGWDEADLASDGDALVCLGREIASVGLPGKLCRRPAHHHRLRVRPNIGRRPIAHALNMKSRPPQTRPARRPYARRLEHNAPVSRHAHCDARARRWGGPKGARVDGIRSGEAGHVAQEEILVLNVAGRKAMSGKRGCRKNISVGVAGGGPTKIYPPAAERPARPRPRTPDRRRARHRC